MPELSTSKPFPIKAKINTLFLQSVPLSSCDPATMVAKKPIIVIVGAGMAGLTAANKLYTATSSKKLFELCVVEGGSRLGGRIHTSQLGGDRIELGATWIHGIGGSPIHKIAQEIHALESEQPWELMDGVPENPVIIAEGGFKLDPSIVEPISNLYKGMMNFAMGKLVEAGESREEVDYYGIAEKAYRMCSCRGGLRELGLGSFLRQGLDAYWVSVKEQENVNGYGGWSRKLLQEGVFALHENFERAYTSANDLSTLDFDALREYSELPDEQITIAKGYSSVIESLASALPTGLIQLSRRVRRIEWQPEGVGSSEEENGCGSRPVKLQFEDGSNMDADHVILTVSLGVLKAGIREEMGMFNPPLPCFKTRAISRLGFGVVDKLFLQLNQTHDQESKNCEVFPFLRMVFHQPDSELRHPEIPWWMRKTAYFCPIYKKSSVLLSWFVGEEAVELESLKDEEIVNGVSKTITSFLFDSQSQYWNRAVNSVEGSDGNGDGHERGIQITGAVKSQWGSDPLFMGSYSYVAVGSSGDDLDLMAEPLPRSSNCGSVASPPLQILFAGEATHRTHYSTTHGAYFSGVREANRLLQHYHCDGF